MVCFGFLSLAAPHLSACHSTDVVLEVTSLPWPCVAEIHRPVASKTPCVPWFMVLFVVRGDGSQLEPSHCSLLHPRRPLCWKDSDGVTSPS